MVKLDECCLFGIEFEAYVPYFADKDEKIKSIKKPQNVVFICTWKIERF